MDQKEQKKLIVENSDCYSQEEGFRSVSTIFEEGPIYQFDSFDGQDENA